MDACGQFIDTWAQNAAELGWRSLDVFGDDLDKQVAEIARNGLLWRMEDGGRVVALTEQTAVIETMIGARITYRRQPAAADVPFHRTAWAGPHSSEASIFCGLADRGVINPS